MPLCLQRYHETSFLSETSSDSDSDVDSGDETDDDGARLQQTFRAATHSRSRRSLSGPKCNKKRKISPKRPRAASPVETSASKSAVSAHDSDEGEGEGESAIPISRKLSSRQSVGLRHFSVLVCEKLAKCQTTSYNIIADQLIAEAKEQMSGVGTVGVGAYDEKNIRRRIYDALNVLMAVGIITKNRKMIFWNGPPAHEMENVDAAHAARAIVHGNNPSFREFEALQTHLNAKRSALAALTESIQSKRADLADLAYSFCAKRYLMQRNQKVTANERNKRNDEWSDKYLMIAVDKDTTSESQHDDERTHFHIKFSSSYTIYDHTALTSIFARYHNIALHKRIPQEITDYIDKYDHNNIQSDTNVRTPGDRLPSATTTAASTNVRRAHSLPLMSPPPPPLLSVNRLPQSTPNTDRSTVPLLSMSPYTRLSVIYPSPIPPAHAANEPSQLAGLFASPAMPLWTNNRATPQSSTRLFTSQQTQENAPQTNASKPDNNNSATSRNTNGKRPDSSLIAAH